jgi:hypothetical protein
MLWSKWQGAGHMGKGHHSFMPCGREGLSKLEGGNKLLLKKKYSALRRRVDGALNTNKITKTWITATMAYMKIGSQNFSGLEKLEFLDQQRMKFIFMTVLKNPPRRFLFSKI